MSSEGLPIEMLRIARDVGFLEKVRGTAPVSLMLLGIQEGEHGLEDRVLERLESGQQGLAAIGMEFSLTQNEVIERAAKARRRRGCKQ